MHRLGVRAARVNLASKSENLSKGDFAALLHLYAKRLRRLKWALQLYIRLPQVALIAEEIPKLGIPVVFDHLAHPYTTEPMASQKGYSDLLSLLQRRLVFVKLSGSYRFPDLADLDQVVREILHIAPTQVVWASDWPHTSGSDAVVNDQRAVYQDFRRVDDAGWIAQCLKWCEGDEDLARKIWVENPQRLWQVDD